MYVYATRATRSLGLSKLGVTAAELTTPRGTLPPGASATSASTYATPKGPYSGVAAVDLAFTVSASGNTRMDILSTIGVDSREWGKFVQDFIHEKVSNSPLFPWPGGTKPLVEGGVEWNRTIPDLTRERFAGLEYTGRLELDAKALTGTRRTEGTVSARFVITTAKVHTRFGDISGEFSPIGALARGFVRYNDGRESPLVGVEAGVNASFMLNIGRVGLGLRPEAIVSTDPAFQTDPSLVKDKTGPTGLSSGLVKYGMPAGHHGTAQVILKFDF
jgi:hypothetical protein